MPTTNRVFLAISILWVFSFVGIYAQQTTGTISGVVKDETGGVLPGVEVTARNTGTEATRTVISDDEGRYRLAQLVPGDYELRAELSGFQTAVLQGISLSVAQQAVVGVTLRVGEISEQVVVSAEVSLIETTTANVGALVDNQTIRDLPLNGRDFIQLAALQEGVVTPTSGTRSRTGDSGVKMTISGTRPNQTAILLDGTDIKNQYGNTPGSVAGAMVGVDTVREFRVLTNVYSAEYGRFTGGVISAVTKSGANQFHGTVFAFHRNSALDARNFFDRDSANPLERSATPPFKRNQFGFTLGGPIKSDQTFFFGSYEGLRERLTTSFISIFPNENAHNGLIPIDELPRGFRDTTTGARDCAPQNIRPGDLCFVGVHPDVQPYMDLYPLPNGLVPEGGTTGQFRFDNPEPTDQDYFVIKIDHQISDSDSFFARYTLDDSNKSDLTETYIYGIASEQRNQYTTIEETHIFSPSLLNEFRFGFNRSVGSDQDMVNIPVPQDMWFRPDREAMGVLQLRGGVSQMGTTTRTPQFHTQNVFQYIDNVVWTRGNHSLKMGVNATRFQYNLKNLARLNGSFAFGSVTEFLQNSPNGSTLFFSEPFMAGMRQSLFGFYLQDDFQLRPTLTINLGLRYEFITSPSEVNGRLGNLSSPSQIEPTVGNPYFSNPSLKNYSPRIGFAWDPTGSGKTSIRGGFGLFHDQLLPWLYTSSPLRMKPFAIRATLEPPQEIIFPTVLRTLTDDHPGVQSPGVTIVLPPDQPYIQQWSLTIQREILPDTALTVTYAGSRGVSLSRPVDVNNPPGVVQADGRRFYDENTPEGTERPNTAYASMGTQMWDANSWYNGLKVGLRKRFTSGFQYQISYHWQKFMDEASTHGGRGETRTSNTTSLDWQDHTLDRGLSAWHTPHTFSTNWSLDLPFGPGRSFGAGLTGVAARLAEGWQINGIVQLASGPAVGIDGDGNVTCDDFCDSRPDLIPGKNNRPNTGDPNAWWGPAGDNFTNQEPGYFGTLGRNTSEGPGLATFDLSINKSFSVGEEASIQFRAEFFNILNHTNFGPPLRTRGAFSRGRANSSFGQILDTGTSSRQIQFALKIIF